MQTFLKRYRWFLRTVLFLFLAISLYFIYSNILHRYTIDSAMSKIESILISHRAISEFISKEQKVEISKLQQNKKLPIDYFNPQLQSGSYITKRIHDYYNDERHKLGKEEYTFKFASQNARNEDNQANEFESGILKRIRNKDISEYTQLLRKDNKNFLYYAIPFKKVTSSCLQCHGNPKDAPKGLVQRYGDTNGFGYELDDITGIISIYAPIDEELKEGKKVFYILFFTTLVIVLILILVFDFIFLQLKKKKEIENRNYYLSLNNKRLEHSIEEQNLTLHKTLSIVSEHIMLSRTDPDGIIIEVSNAFSKISGYSKEELIGRPHSIIRHKDTPKALFKDMWKKIKAGETWSGEIKNLTKDGNYFWVDIVVLPEKNEEDEIIGYASFWHDATYKKRIEEISRIDPLTELFNRREFQHMFEDEVKKSQREQKYFALIMLDVDFFKAYNDNYGHIEGDNVLVKIAKVMHQTFQRMGDFCFRLGGEEFGIFCSANTLDYALEMAEKLRCNISDLNILHIGNKASSVVTVSIGIVVIDASHDKNFDEMIFMADKALYEAKDTGRNQVKVYKES